jgi:short-subunit dehydrogenase
MQVLQGRSALIAGGSGALGWEVAAALARQGVRLVLAARDEQRLARARQRLLDRGFHADWVAGDIRDESGRNAVAREAQEILGHIDILVNCVGQQDLTPFELQSPAMVQEMFEVNLIGPMLLTQQLLEPMLAAGRGHIVHIASIAGLVPLAHMETYGASKAGLISFTHALRASYRHRGVSASVICPGMTDQGVSARMLARAPSAQPRRLLQTERVADAVVRAIRGDAPELCISVLPVRPLLLAHAASARAGELLVEHLGLNRFFRSLVSTAQ